MLSGKNRYILSLVVLCAVLTILLIIYGNLIFENVVSIKGIGFAIAMFTFFDIFSIWLIERKNKKITPRQSVNFLLGIKVGKILLTLAFVAIYAIMIKVELQRFFLVFITLYLIYLFINTYYLTRREKKLRTTVKTKQLLKNE